MSLVDAVKATGLISPDVADRATKKRDSEVLSAHLALEVAGGLRAVGFHPVYPEPGGSGERTFHGGLGPKRVDVAHSDEQHGLLLAVSIKTISFPPFGKNLKNRFADLCTEAITLHMRFPYSVICALFAFPAMANEDQSSSRRLSTFARASELFATVAGRQQYTDPPEQFDDVTVLLYQPVTAESREPWVELRSTTSGECTETRYFRLLREIYERRYPHAGLSGGH